MITKTKNFIIKSRSIHGSKYDYSKTKYESTHKKVIIVCPKHGEFKQRPSSHLMGHGCRFCNGGCGSNTNSFIKKANKIHDNRYNYSAVRYINNTTKIIIICSIHGEFKQTPQCHLVGQGCPKCGRTRSIDSRRDTTKSFIVKSKKKHGNEYDYSKVQYVNQRTKIIIICKKHGEFLQAPNDHIQGHGCVKCGNKLSISCLFLSTEDFITKANLRHNNKYDYSKVNYKSTYEKVTIMCPKHGEFKQRPNSHLNGSGCPNCPAITSSGHKELLEFMSLLNNEIIENEKTIIAPYELDIYVPSIKLGIEYDGLYWHSAGTIEEDVKKKHKQSNKANICNLNDIRLIQIREDEWLNKREIVKSIVRHAANKSSCKIYARKCSIKHINNKDYRHFMLNNHIQGHRPASIKIGLIHNDQTVMIMSFNKHPKYGWEITRMASLLGHSVVGGASKIFKYFIKTQKPKSIMTFADRRYATGITYKHLGFKLDSITNPNYVYIKNKKVFSRQHFQKKKQKDRLKTFDPTKSERENMFNNKYRRFWDSGHVKFIWTR